MADFKTLPDIEGTFHDLLGYTFVDWKDGFVKTELLLQPKHKNRQGWVHGGVILSMMDVVSTFAGNYGPDGPVQSVTVNISCNFISGTNGEKLLCEGRLVRKGRSTFFTENRVLEGGSEQLLATSQGVHKLL